MILDEAIKHAEEVAEEQDELFKQYDEASRYFRNHNKDIVSVNAKVNTQKSLECFECAKEHRQLAEWLKELKKYKEKDIPKLVVYSGDGYADGKMVYDMAECPNCEREFEYGRDEWEMPFCCACGQALKWEVEE